MIRNVLRWILTIIHLVIVPFAPAQQTGKVPRVGFLHSGFYSTSAPFIEVFRHTLRELGYIEGQNLILEYRFAEERFDRLPGLANELVGLPVDVILTAGNQAISAARQATKTIPIVMATSGDAVRQGFVEQLRRPI
jgi:putative ABC transport system substrate-binding protein